MIRLIYSSSAPNVAPSDLEQILQVADRYNEEHGITGILLYGKGVFMQVLEGPDDAVRALYERIEQDPRHENCNIIGDEPLDDRTFGGWNMAYANLTDEGARKIGGSLGIDSIEDLLRLIREQNSYVSDFVVSLSKQMLDVNDT